jgi:hypothetical protein
MTTPITKTKVKQIVLENARFRLNKQSKESILNSAKIWGVDIHLVPYSEIYAAMLKAYFHMLIIVRRTWLDMVPDVGAAERQRVETRLHNMASWITFDIETDYYPNGVAAAATADAAAGKKYCRGKKGDSGDRITLITDVITSHDPTRDYDGGARIRRLLHLARERALAGARRAEPPSRQNSRGRGRAAGEVSRVLG